MYNYHEALVSSLNKVLPTYYELTLTSGTKTPCISYMEIGNYPTVSSEHLEYSRLTYQIKIWGIDLKELQNYAQQIDLILRPIGFKRTNCVELYDTNSAMIQKVLTYSAIALEKYE